MWPLSVTGEEVVYDPQQAYDTYFGHLISLHYGDASVAYETLQFITDNLETLCYKTNVLSKYFPNIFKVSVSFISFIIFSFRSSSIFNPVLQLGIFHDEYVSVL